MPDFNIIPAKIKTLLDSLDVDFSGVADLTLAGEFIREQGGEVAASYPRAISVGIALLHSVVDQLPRRAERDAAVNYRQHAYDIVNQRLDHLVSRLASLLQREGFRALPVPASKRTDDVRLCSFFSHKLAANLAGLGWIGKSCLLVTPQAGPRVRWATVLTDAPLVPTGSMMVEGCGECQKCVDICPVGAFTGRSFSPDEPRAARYDAQKCDRYFKKMEAENPETAVCGLCLFVCPYGRTQRPL